MKFTTTIFHALTHRSKWDAILIMALACSTQMKALNYYHPQPRMRVIIDNDFAGDSDGLVALTHHLLSPSVDVRGVSTCYFPMKESPYGYRTSKTGATICASLAKDVVKMLNQKQNITVAEGSNTPMPNDSTASESEGANLIIREAMRTDTKSKLYVCCGGSLNTIASAWLKEPRITNRMVVVWIGGEENLGDLQILPPGRKRIEYNTDLDLTAAQVVFNKSKLDIWMVPRHAYRLCLYSYAEILDKMKSAGKLGEYLFDRINTWYDNTHHWCGGTAETYVPGDSSLVLLTALQSIYEADPSSSKYVMHPCPALNPKGNFVDNPSGNPYASTISRTNG